MGSEQLLLGLLNMGMGGMQSSQNTMLGMIPMGMSIYDRFRARTDPLMKDIGGILGMRYNQAVSQNPYGDPYGAWGGMFGTHADGTPIGFGEAQARSIYDMMQNSPSTQTLQNLQNMTTMQRPTSTSAVNGASQLMGYGPVQGQAAQSADIKAPQTSTKTKFKNAPNPTDTSQYTIDPALARGDYGLISRIGGLMNQVPQAGSGGGGASGLGGMVQNYVNSRGGPLALMQALTQPGNAMTNIRQFAGLPGHLGGSPGYAGGGNPYADFWNTHGKAAPGGGRSYAVGTPFVQNTGKALLHQGEAVIPAAQNPYAKAGLGQGFGGGTPTNTGKLPSAYGVGQGMQGGGGNAIPAPPPTGPQSLMQQLIANPMSMPQSVQDQIYNQQAGVAQNAYGAALRQRLAGNAAQMGTGGGTTADLNFGLANQLANARSNIGIQAAQTNTNDLRQAAGLQLQGTLGMGQLQLGQNQLDAQNYQNDWNNQMSLINAMNSTANAGNQTQLGMWGALNQIGNAGINFSNPYLQQLIQNQMWRIQPNPVAGAGVQTQGPPVPIGVPGYGQGGGGYGGGGGGTNWAPLANAVGMYAGSNGW